MPETIRVDEGITYQTILGIGASLDHSSCYNLFRLNESLRNEVAERLFSPDRGIGMSLMRLCIGTSDFTDSPWYSYDDMPAGGSDPELSYFSASPSNQTK
jgi:O-glycosyl hydrolase